MAGCTIYNGGDVDDDDPVATCFTHNLMRCGEDGSIELVNLFVHECVYVLVI